MLRILGLGDSVVDKYVHIRTIHPGGNASSFAVYAKILGIETGYSGVSGDDETAAHIYDTIRGLGLELSHCRFYLGENGYAEVHLDNGDQVFIGSNGGGVPRERPPELTVMDKVYIAGYDIVRTSIFNYIEDELPLLRQISSPVSVDFSSKVGKEYLRQYAPYVDCTGISCGDMPRNGAEKQMTLIREFGHRRIVIVTRGAKGALVMVNGRFYEQLPCLVEAVDTMGARDSFITCFLISYVDAVKDSRDFLATPGTKGTVTAADYQDLAVRTSSYRAAVYSVGNYQKDGSFGSGKVFQNK